MIVEAEKPEMTDDAVLGGRLRLRQPRRGHRVGHDAILLAAATDADAGEHTVDLGAGVGGAGLALASRVASLRVTLIEIDEELAALAAGNAARNGLSDRVTAYACDAENRKALAAIGLMPGSHDRVLMNPPFRDVRRQNLSPDPRRRRAHAAPPGLLGRWIGSAYWLLKPRGVLTLIWRADGLDEVLSSLAPGFGQSMVMPVLSWPDRPPIRVLVRAAKGGEGGPVFRPPLLLNEEDGSPTAAAEAVLRLGKALLLTET